MNLTSSIAATSIDMHSQRVGDSLTTKVMDKAMDMQAMNAAALIKSAIQSAPKPQAINPSHLGQNIDMKV